MSEPNEDASGRVGGGEVAESPRCRCGTDRDSKFSVVHRRYGFFGTLYLLWGGTAVPTRVIFCCVKCGAEFDSSTRPAVCRQYIT